MRSFFVKEQSIMKMSKGTAGKKLFYADSFFRPLFLLRFKTFCPALVLMRSKKP
jgi:hypothetical protein